MSAASIVLIAGDRDVAQRVEDELSDRGIACQVVDPAADSLSEESMFELAFERDAEGVLLVEPLGRCGRTAPPPDPALLSAALAATKTPNASFLGWVTSRPEEDDDIAQLKRSGLPYGIIRPGPVFEVDGAPAPGGAARRQVLVSRELADELAAVRASAIGELAAEIATWVEQEWVREGRVARPPVAERPLEDRLNALGVQPLLLSDWRVGLNSFFGLPVVEASGSEGPLVIHRRPLRLGRHRPQRRGAATSDATDGRCAEAALAGA
ncbi:MAG: hypothetical protein JRI23_04410 [Deltaproteobacteria bacterium]|jgi:hypothetical protein|nr:hypothetical protein [Deltaproteobacteria bacterium]MBW2530783.1 hypothetical protein [Deltaproteobacteria bacterium]